MLLSGNITYVFNKVKTDMKTDVLVIKLQKGDKNAFRPIVEAYQAEIRTLIACNGINLADVDDIAQATFLHIYQNIDRFQLGTNFRSWIRTIAMYKTKAFLEEKKREFKNKNLLLQYYLVEQSLQMPKNEKEDRAHKLARCLEKLGQRARSLVKKRYEGIPLSVIAKEWGRTVPAIKMMLLRIRNQLRNCVETQP
jgi:RNA polymerase sigma-70 factor (ECF subfamily)